MQMLFKVIFWTFWLSLGFIFHIVLLCYYDDKELRSVFLVILAIWWLITGIIALVKWREYRIENPPLTKEEKQRLKQWKNERKYRNSEEFKKKYLSDVEIENLYFGHGILVRDSSHENICYTDIKSGFERIFDPFGRKSDTGCDLYEFIVQEDNIEYVLTSLEKIYKKSEQIMEECYDEIYKELVEFLNGTCDDCLKDNFDLAYLKENWNVYGIAIYDDHAVFSIGIDAAKNPDDDSNYNIIISVDYDKQEPDVSFDVVW